MARNRVCKEPQALPMELSTTSYKAAPQSCGAGIPGPPELSEHTSRLTFSIQHLRDVQVLLCDLHGQVDVSYGVVLHKTAASSLKY